METFLLESIAILSGLTAVIIGTMRPNMRWLAAIGAFFVVGTFLGMYVFQGR